MPVWASLPFPVRLGQHSGVLVCAGMLKQNAVPPDDVPLHQVPMGYLHQLLEELGSGVMEKLQAGPPKAVECPAAASAVRGGGLALAAAVQQKRPGPDVSGDWLLDGPMR